MQNADVQAETIPVACRTGRQRPAVPSKRQYRRPRLSQGGQNKSSMSAVEKVVTKSKRAHSGLEGADRGECSGWAQGDQVRCNES